MEAGETRTDEQLAVNIIRSAHSLFSRFKVLFADGIFSFEDRRESQALFSKKDAKWAFKVIEIELSFVYDRLYTKASVSRRQSGIVIRIITLLLTLAASLYTFVTLHATQFRMRHRCVTYTLLTGAVLTEAAILACYFCSIWSLVDSDFLKCCSVNLVDRCRWSGYMAQSNLITFCLQKLPTDSELKSFFVVLSHPRPCRVPYIGLSVPAGFMPAVNRIRLLLPVLEPYTGAGHQTLAVVGEYLQRRSMLDQLQSKSFWKKYKETRYISVEDKIKAFIFNEVDKKGRSFNQTEELDFPLQSVEENETIGTREIEEENQTTETPESKEENQTTETTPYFVDCRGSWVLNKELFYGSLGWSFEDKDFDENLLLWHIATDLCFRQEVNQGNNSTNQKVNPENGITEHVQEHRKIGKEISNYLLYIMMVHPLMLSSSTTMATKRCRDTCAEARRHFLKEHIRAMCAGAHDAVNEKSAHSYLLEVETPLQASVVKGDKSKSVLWDGCALAKQLDQITDKAKKWRVISRVWVEMLCYAAVHCGGYQHAERLSEGGELITFVCLLMTHLGMGKHYRTKFGDAHPHLSPFTSQLASKPAPAKGKGTQTEVLHTAITMDVASSSGTAGHP